MDATQLPTLITALTGLVAAVATLITVLKSHSTINTIADQTNGTLKAVQQKLDAANARAAGHSRATDPPGELHAAADAPSVA